MVVLFSQADWLLIIWDGMIGGVIASIMFNWGRRYERKQKARREDWKPKEPTM